MELEVALYSRLSSYSGLAALVGTRIYPDLSTGTGHPHVVYSQNNETPTRASGGDRSLTSSAIQVTAWGLTPGSRDAVAAQVMAALRDYSGTITVGGESLAVQCIFFNDRNNRREVDPETKISAYGAQLDFTVWWEA